MTTAAKRTRARKATPAKTAPATLGGAPGPDQVASPPAVQVEPTPAAPTKAKHASRRCNVPECRRKATRRGLCDPHWGTHRGLADPKEKDR